MLLPYREIGYVLALLLCVLAFTKAGKTIKIIIAAVVVIFFVLPFFFPEVVDALTLFYVRIAAGVACYLFFRLKGISCRC